MIFQAEILIKPREGVLDTQGKAVEKALSRLGYTGLEKVRVGKVVTMNLEAADKDEAERALVSMCSDLLCNELIETFDISVRQSEL